MHSFDGAARTQTMKSTAGLCGNATFQHGWLRS